MRAHPATVYGLAPRLWHHGAVCLVLGSGPSLKRSDVELARRHVDGVIAVNDAYLYAPDATALYAADLKWWKWHHGATAPHLVGRTHYPAFTGRYRVMLAHSRGSYPPGVMILQKGPETGLTADPARLALGRNSVYQATNLAVHFGARRVLYLGVDMQGGPGAHFFGRHPDNSGPPIPTCLQRFATLAPALESAGIELWNCTRATALTCFPRLALEDAIARPAPRSVGELAHA